MEEAVSVRGGMLAILTIGPAYGSQLLSEFQRRAVHRAPVNVGQAYTTLDRLSKQGLVETAGTTADGLTLFALTEAGRVAADAWLRDASGSMGSDNWDEMLDRVLIARSLPNSPHDALIKSYAALWKQRGAIRNPASNARTPHDHEGTNLVARANALVADAALRRRPCLIPLKNRSVAVVQIA